MEHIASHFQVKSGHSKCGVFWWGCHPWWWHGSLLSECVAPSSMSGPCDHVQLPHLGFIELATAESGEQHTQHVLTGESVRLSRSSSPWQ
eukprot:6152278-Lingulodinium_polyedra.AAC.1